MKHAIHITIMAIFFGLTLSVPVGAFDGGDAYEAGDGHWVYFGPDSSNHWTAPRIMPRKRSLTDSIRRDALRHYAMPEYELPESGEVLTFDGAKRAPRTAAAVGPVEGSPSESPWEAFELPESGHVIRFAKDATPPPADATIVARRNE